MSEIIFDKIKYPILIRYKENEGRWLTSWEREPHKTYSDVFNIDDVNHIYSSIAFISETENEINYIASFRRGKIVATRKIRITFNIVIKLGNPLVFNYIEMNSSKAMAGQVQTAFSNNNNLYYLNKYQTKTIISALLQLDNNNLGKLKRILLIDKKTYPRNNKNFITSTERDVLGTIFRINKLENEINRMIEWNIEDFTTPDFMKDLQTVNVREDLLIIKDSKIFGDWQVLNDDVHGVCTLTNGTNCVTIIYANRTKIESNIGVDLIYFDHINHSYIFVQYKRLAEENNKFIYRPTSDKNLDKELCLMESLEKILSKDLSDYRFSEQVFFFKFCKERQEVYTRDLSNGFYMPKDYFLMYNKTMKKSGSPVAISYETITRYLNNTLFIELIKSGLIGSRINDANLISNIIEGSLSNNKSLILASSIPNPGTTLFSGTE